MRARWLSLLVLVAGCGGGPAPTPSVPLSLESTWPKFRGNARQDGVAPIHPNLTSRSPWKFPTGKGVFSSPIVGGDETVYFGSADRTFYALDPNGGLKWKLLTGEIIDSSGLLDNQGRIYFGSGDGKLRALDAASGSAVWTMSADDPKSTGAFINWFEGNVAMAPSGTLVVPNDGFQIYDVDRVSGMATGRIKMPDQTWSSPAVDAADGSIFLGNNNTVAFLGSNLFAFRSDGTELWESYSPGTVAASPMLTGDGGLVVGGFDGYVRSYNRTDGTVRWEFATRDHIYASPSQLSDGTIVQPSCDGTVYGLAPEDGTVRWTFDTREPLRSSPAVDIDDNIYFGSGEGRLFVLGPGGKLRWSMQLIDADRNDLNASPALGNDAIYIGGESGEVFGIPYDWCLNGGATDPRCAPTSRPPLMPNDSTLLPVTAFGALLDEAPQQIDRNQPLGFQLVVRANNVTQLAVIDSSSVKVTVTPPADVMTEISGDGKFLLVTPLTGFAPGAIQVDVSADYLVDLKRTGLKLSGGTKGGTAKTSFVSTVAPDLPPFTLPIPKQPGDPSGVWEISRLSLPLPTMLPSYNQIGFDSLHYLVGLVEGDGTTGVAWMIGAQLASDENQTIIDPATKAIFPLALDFHGGDLTLASNDGLRVEVMNVTIPFRSFRIAAPLDGSGDSSGARISGSTICAQVPMYGLFLQQLGLCNPQTDVLTVFGASNLHPWNGGKLLPPTGVGQVAFTGSLASGVTATLTGSSLKLADHVYGVAIVDATTGAPVTLDYGLSTVRKADGGGILQSVTIPFGSATVPQGVRAYLMLDTYPAASATLTLQ
jgi:outer membrane protein assembly factor BamB